jgi:DNA-directed RNA polymerase specialized sigma24 family protein
MKTLNPFTSSTPVPSPIDRHQLIAEYQRSPSVRLRNKIVLSYDRYIKVAVRNGCIYDKEDCYQFVMMRLTRSVDRNASHENIHALALVVIQKSILCFLDKKTFGHLDRQKTVLIKDLLVFELQLAKSYAVGRSVEEIEVLQIIKSTCKDAPQQLLVVKKVCVDGWNFEDITRIHGLTNKQINSSLTKARKKLKKVLFEWGYEIPTNQTDRKGLHAAIIKARQEENLGLKALATRFGYTRKGIWNILRDHNVA